MNYLGTMPWEGECGKTSTLKLTKLPNMAWTWFSKRSLLFDLNQKNLQLGTLNWPENQKCIAISSEKSHLLALSLTLLPLCTSAAHGPCDIGYDISDNNITTSNVVVLTVW